MALSGCAATAKPRNALLTAPTGPRLGCYLSEGGSNPKANSDTCQGGRDPHVENHCSSGLQRECCEPLNFFSSHESSESQTDLQCNTLPPIVSVVEPGSKCLCYNEMWCGNNNWHLFPGCAWKKGLENWCKMVRGAQVCPPKIVCGPQLMEQSLCSINPLCCWVAWPWHPWSPDATHFGNLCIRAKSSIVMAALDVEREKLFLQVGKKTCLCAPWGGAGGRMSGNSGDGSVQTTLVYCIHLFSTVSRTYTHFELVILMTLTKWLSQNVKEKRNKSR